MYPAATASHDRGRVDGCVMEEALIVAGSTGPAPSIPSIGEVPADPYAERST